MNSMEQSEQQANESGNLGKGLSNVPNNVPEKENIGSHQFTGNGPGVIGADNCQVCGRWFDQPETDVCKNTLITPPATSSEASGWLDIDDVAVSGERILLLWEPVGGLSEHVELGKFSQSYGWVNTYGKPFASSPDKWAPLAPFLPPPAPSGEAVEALETAWSNFCDFNPDDLTSPEDLPDHALMTCAQFVEYASVAVFASMQAPEGWQTKALDDVAAERLRQVEAEGWTPRHDDTHGCGEMATAAACYALATTGFKREALWEIWPKAWGVAWFKPTTSRRDLVKAGALILSEIERLDRLSAASAPQKGGL